MRIQTAVLLPLLCVTACNEGGKTKARSSGSIAASTDDALVYAADTDNGILAVMDVKTESIVKTIKVGDAPWRVVVGSDDTVYVANRGSRSISVIRRGEDQVGAELATDIDPVGLTLDEDGTLYVVCAAASEAAEYGTLTAFDTKTLTKQWTLRVGEEPRGIAIIAGKRALVSLYHEGEVVEVDLAQHALVKGQRSSIHQSVSTAAINTGSDGLGGKPVAFHPRGTGEVIAVPDGTRAFVVGSLSREAPIVTPPSTVTPYYKAQGPGLAGSVTTSAVFTFDTAAEVTPKIDDVSTSNGYYSTYGSAKNDVGYPQTSFAAALGYQILQGPTVGVTDYTGEWMYLVNRETGRLALISAKARNAKPVEEQQNNYNYYSYATATPSLRGTASIGKGADGIVVLGDNKKVYVYNQFDHAITPVIWADGDIEGGTAIPVARDILSPDQVAGRKLFFDATDRRISAVEASVACSSCHLEGRDDGHTWSFPDGPRQTPTLAGRGTLHTAPFHWSGEFATIDAFLTHTLTARMGGTGLDAASSNQLNAYMDKLPAPENPYAVGKDVLTEAQLRGKAVFAKAQCGTCHAGEWLTNNGNMNVATLTAKDNGMVVKGGLNVPSLRGLARSGPYLHDGSVVTLSERVTKNPDDRHGVTSTLSQGEVDDLVAYLRAL